MPFLDVTDVLDDPDFSQFIEVKRSVNRIDENGESKFDIFKYKTHGVVQPISAQELIRLPNAERLQGGCTVYTKFQLIAGHDDISADIIDVNNSSYVVVSVDNWGNFGLGYTMAKCALLNMRDNGDTA